VLAVGTGVDLLDRDTEMLTRPRARRLKLLCRTLSNCGSGLRVMRSALLLPCFLMLRTSAVPDGHTPIWVVEHNGIPSNFRHRLVDEKTVLT